jgi:hypothetical protein
MWQRWIVNTLQLGWNYSCKKMCMMFAIFIMNLCWRSHRSNTRKNHFITPASQLLKMMNENIYWISIIISVIYCRYIYDYAGVELHCLKKHDRPYRVGFLPYHFLLTTVGHSGWLKWHDISTGKVMLSYTLFAISCIFLPFLFLICLPHDSNALLVGFEHY